MNVLFLTDNFPPEVNAPATRTYEHCKRWVERGAEVTVLTCAPNFPQGKVYPGYKNRLWSRECIDGVEVIRLWTFITPNEGFLLRILDYLSFSCHAFCAGLFRKCDIIVATSPQFFTTLAGFSLSICKRRPWIFELRDLWPDTVTAVGAMKEGWLIRLFEKIEMLLYKHATRVVPVTEAFKRKLIGRGVDESKIHVISNGVDRSKFFPRDKDAELLAKYHLEGKFVFGYIGTHGMCHGLDFIVNSLDGLEDDEIQFIFVGAGACKKDIVARADELRLNNITFLEPVLKEDVPRYISIIDASLVPLKKAGVFETVVPTKIFESAAMAKPILLGVNGQAREIIERFDCGIFYEPECRDEFLSVAITLARDKKLHDRLRSGCQNLAQHFDRCRLADEMLKVMEDVI